MIDHEYRPILVRKTLTDGSTIEFVVHGVEDVRTAAVMVFEGIKSTAVEPRYRFNPQTGAEDKYDPELYRAVIEIEANKLTTLPDFQPTPDDLNDYDRAAQKAVALFADQAGVDPAFTIAMPALMRGIIGLSYDLEVNMAELITDLGNDRPEHGRDDTPRLLGPLLKSLSVELGGDKQAAKAAMDLYVRDSGIEGAEDPYVAMYHLVYGLIEVSAHEPIDFTKSIAQILEDADEATPAAAMKP